MGRRRVALRAVRHGGSDIVKFLHPVRKITVTGTLGAGDEAIENLRQLNVIFLNKDNWYAAPQGTADRVRLIWFGQNVQASVDPTADETFKRDVEAVLREQLATALRQADHFKNLYEQVIGRPVRVGLPPTLQQAYDAFKLSYVGRDKEHTANVLYDLDRFIKHFSKKPDVDAFFRGEAEIDTWLRGLAVGPGRRHTIRIYVLKMLEASGVKLDRSKVVPIKRKQIRQARGAIRWLERKQAQLLARRLRDHWRDCWLVQVALGLRPSELITLERGDFSPDFSELHLSPLGEHTLKTGTRSIQVPAQIRTLLRARLKANAAANAARGDRKGRFKAWPPALEGHARAELVFPNPHTGERWPSDRYFFREYHATLKAAKPKSIKLTIDCRMGRRTCGSLLLRAGRSVEDVAAILGDRPETIREHYARILSGEVDPSAAAI